MAGADNALQALQGYQGIVQQGGINLEQILKGYTELKKLDQDQKKIEEEKAYHQGYLNLTAATAGYRPAQGAAGAAPNPYAFEPDPAQLQTKQAQATAELQKAQADQLSKLPHGIGSRIGAWLGDPQSRQELALYRQALGQAGAPDLPESGLPPASMWTQGGGLAGIGNAIARRLKPPSSSFKVSRA